MSVFDRADRALERARHAVEGAEMAVEVARRRRRDARLRRMLVIGRPRPTAEGHQPVRHREPLPVEPAAAALLRERLGGPSPR